MDKKYAGSWRANNGSTYSDGYEGNNKRELAKDMRDMCRGNVFAGNTGYWDVSDKDGNIIMSGMCR